MWNVQAAPSGRSSVCVDVLKQEKDCFLLDICVNAHESAGDEASYERSPAHPAALAFLASHILISDGYLKATSPRRKSGCGEGLLRILEIRRSLMIQMPSEMHQAAVAFLASHISIPLSTQRWISEGYLKTISPGRKSGCGKGLLRVLESVSGFTSQMHLHMHQVALAILPSHLWIPLRTQR